GPLGHAALVLHESREDAVQVLGVLEVVADDGGGVRVVHHPGLEERVGVPPLAVEHVVDDATEEYDVRPRPHGRVDVGHGAGAGEPWVDVDDLGPVLHLGLHGPAEGYRVVLSHVGAHDHDAVRVRHAPRIEGGRPAPEPCPQTGDAGAVSDPGLILDGHHAQAAHELLLDVVELDLQSSPAQREDGRGHVHELAARQPFDERLVPGLLDQLGHPVESALEIPDLPVRRPGRTVQDLRGTVGIHVQLEDGGSLGAERALVVRASRVAFDVHDLVIHGVDEGAAPYRAVGTDAGRHFRVLDPKLLGLRDQRTEIDAGADQPG